MAEVQVTFSGLNLSLLISTLGLFHIDSPFSNFYLQHYCQLAFGQQIL